MPTKKENACIPPLVTIPAKSLGFLCMSALLVACTSITPLTTVQHKETDISFKDLDNQDHETLAHQYENMANEIQAKAQEQKASYENKPYSNQFGKNRKKIKISAELKIRQYERTADEYRKKAAYHKAMAIELAAQQSAARQKTGVGSGQLDKAKVFLDDIASPENTGKF